MNTTKFIINLLILFHVSLAFAATNSEIVYLTPTSDDYPDRLETEIPYVGYSSVDNLIEIKIPSNVLSLVKIKDENDTIVYSCRVVGDGLVHIYSLPRLASGTHTILIEYQTIAFSGFLDIL